MAIRVRFIERVLGLLLGLDVPDTSHRAVHNLLSQPIHRLTKVLVRRVVGVSLEPYPHFVYSGSGMTLLPRVCS